MGFLHTRHQIALDTTDSYHTFKPFLLLLLGIYLVVFLLNHHITQVDPRTKLQTSIAKDGLRLGVNEEIPEWLVNVHAGCAMTLLAMAILQKEVVVKMRDKYAEFIATHRFLGRACLLLIGVMDAAGFVMGRWSRFENFNILSILFAAPWVVFLVGLYFTATPKWMVWHRIFGNMLLKGCIATPLSRWCGALLQRSGWRDAPGYYEGIGGVTVLVGLWSMVDLYAVFRKEKV